MLYNLLEVQDMASRQEGSPTWVWPLPKYIANHWTLYYPVILALKNIFTSAYRNDLNYFLCLFIKVCLFYFFVGLNINIFSYLQWTTVVIVLLS